MNGKFELYCTNSALVPLNYSPTPVVVLRYFLFRMKNSACFWFKFKLFVEGFGMLSTKLWSRSRFDETNGCGWRWWTPGKEWKCCCMPLLLLQTNQYNAPLLLDYSKSEKEMQTSNCPKGWRTMQVCYVHHSSQWRYAVELMNMTCESVFPHF